MQKTKFHRTENRNPFLSDTFFRTLPGRSVAVCGSHKVGVPVLGEAHENPATKQPQCEIVILHAESFATPKFMIFHQDRKVFKEKLCCSISESNSQRRLTTTQVDLPRNTKRCAQNFPSHKFKLSHAHNHKQVLACGCDSRSGYELGGYVDSTTKRKSCERLGFIPQNEVV